jgi:PAS domain S-box-containing protein
MIVKQTSVCTCGRIDQFAFEALVTELSTRFIHLPADRVWAEIEVAQQRVCECLGFDIGAFWEWETEEQKTILLTHLYRPSGGPPVPERMTGEEFFPWCQAQLLAGKTVVVPSTENTPPEAAVDQAAWRHYGVRSLVAIPLTMVGQAMMGVIGFNSTKHEVVWSDVMIKRLELIAQMFTNALLRKRYEQALRISEERLSLAASAADLGLWNLDLASGIFWATNEAREQFEVNAEETLTLDRVLETIHPDDRAAVQRELDDVVALERNGQVEYRVVRKDGRQRWLATRGRVRTDIDGRKILMGVTVDITERWEADKRLRENLARTAAALDVARIGSYEVLNGVRVTFVDRRACEIIGLPEIDEKSGRILEFWSEHIHPEDIPRVMEVRQAMEQDGCDRMTLDYRFLHPERGVVFIHHLAHVMERDAAGIALRTIGVMQDITHRKQNEEDLRHALDEVQQLQDQLKDENMYLREQMRRDDGNKEIVGESEPMVQMLTQAKRVAPTDSLVLITGETGTGKELLAQAIHDMSRRKARPMVKVNCAALPAPLIEGELFGREKGAYTGAMTKQAGRFEVADGSSIFLDEIGDLPLDLQAKLLRVLQDGTFQRLGSTHTIKVNTRVIAATNHDLSAMVQAGTFRADLYHRLNVFPITVPALRSRVEDIPALVWQFVQEFNSKMGRSIDTIPRAVMDQLKAYPWPGNVRELRNLIERAVIISDGRKLVIDLPVVMDGQPSELATMEDVERRHICHVLEHSHWRISGKGGAAEVLGLVPTTLHSRMKKLGISRPGP